jgi:BCD family chlorophyll transporter-like MFS transporter
MVLNSFALWKQEPRTARRAATDTPPPAFREAWDKFIHEAGSIRPLVVVGLGTIAFSMQDVLLEPYGGQILHLAVATTTKLTALLAIGGVLGFILSARLLDRGLEPYRLAALGVLAGLGAFTCVIFAAPLYSLAAFAAGTMLIGFGSALFLVGTLSAAMATAKSGFTGLALGTWGAVQAFAAGCAIAAGGVLKSFIAWLAEGGLFGQALAIPATGYSAVYAIEVVLLLATLVAAAPLLRSVDRDQSSRPKLA